MRNRGTMGAVGPPHTLWQANPRSLALGKAAVGLWRRAALTAAEERSHDKWVCVWIVVDTVRHAVRAMRCLRGAHHEHDGPVTIGQPSWNESGYSAR